MDFIINFFSIYQFYYIYFCIVFYYGGKKMAKWHKIKKQQSRRASSRSMKRALRRLQQDPSMNFQEILDVTEVIIRTQDKIIKIEDPQTVTMMEIPGQGKVYQILSGKEITKGVEDITIEEERIEEKPAKKIEIPLEDIQLVAQQAGVSEDKAREALIRNDGDLAKAILELKK